LSELQEGCALVESEELFRGAFWSDVRPMLAAWREARGMAADPLEALRTSGYVDRIAQERGGKTSAVGSYA
jgi:L-rhamnose isomerase / sugar isomerase